jgi:hypothetical protein
MLGGQDFGEKEGALRFAAEFQQQGSNHLNTLIGVAGAAVPFELLAHDDALHRGEPHAAPCARPGWGEPALRSKFLVPAPRQRVMQPVCRKAQIGRTVLRDP